MCHKIWCDGESWKLFDFQNKAVVCNGMGSRYGVSCHSIRHGNGFWCCNLTLSLFLWPASDSGTRQCRPGPVAFRAVQPRGNGNDSTRWWAVVMPAYICWLSNLQPTTTARARSSSSSSSRRISGRPRLLRTTGSLARLVDRSAWKRSRSRSSSQQCVRVRWVPTGVLQSLWPYVRWL